MKGVTQGEKTLKKKHLDRNRTEDLFISMPDRGRERERDKVYQISDREKLKNSKMWREYS